MAQSLGLLGATWAGRIGPLFLMTDQERTLLVVATAPLCAWMAGRPAGCPREECCRIGKLEELMERQNIENCENSIESVGIAPTRRRFLVGAGAAVGMVALPGLPWDNNSI